MTIKLDPVWQDDPLLIKTHKQRTRLLAHYNVKPKKKKRKKSIPRFTGDIIYDFQSETLGLDTRALLIKARKEARKSHNARRIKI